MEAAYALDKGFYQVFFTYGKHLVKSTFCYHRFAAYDMFMTIAPGMLLSLISMLANATFLIVGGLSHGFLATEVEMQACAASLHYDLHDDVPDLLYLAADLRPSLSTSTFIVRKSGAW